MNDPAPITAYGAEGLEALIKSLGEPPYRATQLTRWLYQRHASSYDEMTDLSIRLRTRLSDAAPLLSAEVLERQTSSDGTRKYLVRLGGVTSVEVVGLPTSDRLTVCFSTQAGCAMGCSFCATGRSGFRRNLLPGEMVQQVGVVASDFGARVTNVVAMGQGEPFANYDHLLAGLRLINCPDGPGIGARHITVSTCGLIPGIQRFAHEPEQFTLAVSLHAARQSVRDRLMPGVTGMPLVELREAIRQYAAETSRRCSLEYALIDGVNDTDEDVSALVSFCEGLLVHVNLIPLNPVATTDMADSSAARVQDIARRLDGAGIAVSVRAERGADIDAACGQLRQRHESAD